MNTHKLKLYTGFICMALLLPVSGNAYETTSQTATRINSETILYTVSYKFGFLNRELLMPIVAKRHSEQTDKKSVEYAILNHNLVNDKGNSTALVLTNDEDVEIRDGQYYLPEGRSAEFTLMVILSNLETMPNQDLSLLVKHLPFTMIEDGKQVAAELNPSELQYYRTPVITLQ